MMRMSSIPASRSRAPGQPGRRSRHRRSPPRRRRSAGRAEKPRRDIGVVQVTCENRRRTSRYWAFAVGPQALVALPGGIVRAGPAGRIPGPRRPQACDRACRSSGTLSSASVPLCSEKVTPRQSRRRRRAPPYRTHEILSKVRPEKSEKIPRQQGNLNPGPYETGRMAAAASPKRPPAPPPTPRRAGTSTRFPSPMAVLDQ